MTWNRDVASYSNLNEVIDITAAQTANEELKNLNEVITIEHKDDEEKENLNESKTTPKRRTRKKTIDNDDTTD